jgi:hypothetical protein
MPPCRRISDAGAKKSPGPRWFSELLHGIRHNIAASWPSSLKTGRYTVKQTRKFQALLSCTVFLGIAKLFETVGGSAVDEWRVAFWSVLGVASYIVLSGVFGFDPYRTKIAKFAPPMIRYVDRWELRLGQATLAMLGCVVLAASFIDSTNFVTAVVSGTLAAWTYFVLRLYVGGYDEAKVTS